VARSVLDSQALSSAEPASAPTLKPGGPECAPTLKPGAAPAPGRRAGRPLLQTERLSFAYGQKRTLIDISFRLDKGDLIALVGPNGVGKSTLFRCLLGFMRGYTGKVLVAGEDLRTLSSRSLARAIAYIPQSTAQVFDFTVLELTLMGLTSRLSHFKTPGKKETAEAMEVLEGLGIVHLAYRGCGQISGGEYQLALMARALLQKAQVLLMDEPTANLDYGNQFRVMQRVSALAADGLAVIFSAHDPNQVLYHAKRALVLADGRLKADGPPSEVLGAKTLEALYGIEVKRFVLNEEGREMMVCLPWKTKEG
jgi:iron complex transport system ATP-binding protein